MTKMKNRCFLFSAMLCAALCAALVAFAGCDNPASPANETSYAVEFDSGGAGEVSGQTVDSGGKAARPSPDPARIGHVFDGWYLSLNSGEAWDFAADTVSANITLYAKWTANQYTVSFNSQGGSSVDSQSVPHGGKAVEPEAPARGALILEGWYKESGLINKWDFDFETVTGPVILYAKWVDILPGHFLVTFNVRGGSPVESQTVAENGKVAEPDAPTRTDYVFDAWYKETAAVNVWDFDTDTITARTTLYAGWIPLWTVTFNTQQGSPVEPLTGVVDGELIERPGVDPTRDGYSFAGWHKTAAGADNPWNFATDTVTGNTVVYARWIPLYTVTFNTGDGSDVAPLANVLSGATITKPGDPNLENCAFEGWYKEAAYTNKWDFAVDTVTEPRTLYARWTVTVTFIPNGGTPAPANPVLTRGSRVPEPDPEPGIAGQTFMGWYKEIAYTNEWDFAEDTVDVNTTLYARWEFIEATNITRPADGIIGEALALGAVAVEPPNASITKIEWAVTDPGTTGVSAANSYTPTGIGTVKLTATIKGGRGEGTDYTRNFEIAVTRIREVTGISGIGGMIASGIYPAGAAIDLNTARVTPPNASSKTIVWTIHTAGAGVNSIDGNVFVLSQRGRLTLTATVADGKEDGSDYTRDFVFFVEAQIPGEVGWDDGSIELCANGGPDPLPTDAPIRITAGEPYYISIMGTGHSDVVWRLNGTLSGVTGPMLELDTTTAGTVVVRVEAKKSGKVDDGVYTFIIE